MIRLKSKDTQDGRRWFVEGPIDEVVVGRVRALKGRIKDGKTVEVDVGSLGQPWAKDNGVVLVRGYLKGQGCKKATEWHHEACACCGDPGGVVSGFAPEGDRGYLCLSCARKSRWDRLFRK